MPSQSQKTKGLAEAKPLFLLQLSGAGDRNRTGDLRITNALLYQLSYTGAAATLCQKHFITEQPAMITQPLRPIGRMHPAMPNAIELLHHARYRAHWRALLALLCAVAAWFAFTPGRPPPPGFYALDKLQHLLAFGAMATAGALGLQQGRAAALRVAAGLLAYGAFIEMVQSMLPTRTAAWDDLLADAVGVLGGLLLARLLRQAWPDRSP
jgi:VanZ family protein